MIRIRAVKQLAKIALDVDLTLPDRGLTAVFGRSESGKTTLINILFSGLMDPDAGKISVNDQVLYDSQRRIKVPVYERRIGYVFQEARLFPHLTVRSNLRYGHKPDGQIRMDEVVNCSASRRCSTGVRTTCPRRKAARRHWACVAHQPAFAANGRATVGARRSPQE